MINIFSYKKILTIYSTIVNNLYLQLKNIKSKNLKLITNFNAKNYSIKNNNILLSTIYNLQLMVKPNIILTLKAKFYRFFTNNDLYNFTVIGNKVAISIGGININSLISYFTFILALVKFNKDNLNKLTYISDHFNMKTVGIILNYDQLNVKRYRSAILIKKDYYEENVLEINQTVWFFELRDKKKLII